MLMQQKAELADLKRQRALEEQRVGVLFFCYVVYSNIINVSSLTFLHFLVKGDVTCS